MQLRFRDSIDLTVNVELFLFEDDHVVDYRKTHNIWTNIGRNYVVKFLKWDDAANWGAGPPPTVEYMGIGIGSEEQTINIATAYPALDAAYPGQNIQDDSDPTISHLERPVIITGANTWLATAVYDEPGSATNPSNVTAKYSYTFGKNDINLSGTYAVVPVSEVSLCLSDQNTTDDPYTGGVAPSYVGALRQVVCAYNGFAPLSKTVKNTLQVVWELRA
jgi:hypothetical protein